MFTNFKDLHKAYGFYDGIGTRNDLSYEEEKAFVADCFDTYEHIGFASTFDTPYGDQKKYVGMKFSVLGRLDERQADLESLPMWKIQFEDGEIVDAFPEEICLAERNKTIS